MKTICKWDAGQRILLPRDDNDDGIEIKMEKVGLRACVYVSMHAVRREEERTETRDRAERSAAVQCVHGETKRPPSLAIRAVPSHSLPSLSLGDRTSPRLASPPLGLANQTIVLSRPYYEYYLLV